MPRKLVADEGALAGVRVEMLETGEERDIAVDGLFVAVGTEPNTEFLAGALTTDETGYILSLIHIFARYWAKHAVSIAHADGGGMIRSPFSAEPARLEIVLLAMQGLGRPGTGQLHLIEFGQFGFDEWNPLPRSEKYFEVPGAYHGWMETIGHQAFVPKTMVPQALMLPEGEKLRWYGHVVCTAPREDQFIPFEFPVDGAPMIHMIWSDSPSWTTCWNGGFAMQEALRSKRVETVVMQHPWFENDTLFADVVLPVSTMFAVSYTHLSLASMRSCSAYCR